MHVDHSPGSQHRFLVGIAEGVEDGGYALNAFLDSELIGGSGHFADAFASLPEDVGVVVFLELLKTFFINTLGHELLPRLVIYQRSKVVDSDLFIFVL